MRVINGGSLASFRFSVDSHNMTVIEADGTEVEPVVVQSLNVMVAQRYSVIIETDRPVGAYAVRAEVLDDMFPYENPFSSWTSSPSCDTKEFRAQCNPCRTLSTRRSST